MDERFGIVYDVIYAFRVYVLLLTTLSCYVSGNPFHCCFRGSPAFRASIRYSKVLDKDDVVVPLLWVKMKRLRMGISYFRVIVICPKLSSFTIMMP
ncbi:hypothetical protein K1719_014828 [Acacia pycnantha]|nr:hypothetical protein K1719_014828 [Acacia pycnantha]